MLLSHRRLKNKVCTFRHCSNPLRDENGTGLCKEHRQHAPKARAAAREYHRQHRIEHKVELSEKQRSTRLKDPEKKRATEYRSARLPLSRYKALLNSGKRRGLEVTLTKEQHFELLKIDSCRYCKGPLPETGSALDRKDNSKGYTPDNVVTCCASCNWTKNQLLTETEMAAVADLLKDMRGTDVLWTPKTSKT